MPKDIEDVVAAIGRSEEVVEMLDLLLTEPGDRAYVVCSAFECLNNGKGRCSIHTVKGRRRILGNGRCTEYVV
jgi:hypothetical protein